MRAVVAAALLLAIAAQPATKLDAVLDALSIYLDTYEAELSAIVAEERLVQETTARARIERRRVLVSDVTFMRLPGDGLWLGYRDVRRVDNREIKKTGPGLLELLAKPSRDLDKLANEIAWASAEYNLGTRRTINMPSLPLEFMHRRNRSRFSYRWDGYDRVGGTPVVRVEFEETVRPSLIGGGSERRDVMSKGTIYVEADSGRLWRADIKAREPKTGDDWKLSVIFMRDATLDMLVPHEAREEFFVPRAKGTGVARYSNFRKFTTAARILPQ
jgi:hypothetical protein